MVTTHSDETDYRAVVRKAGNLNITGGTSNVSSEGTTHSYSDDEKFAFVDWINYVLADDPICRSLGLVPISEEGNHLFTAVNNGVLLCKLINDSVKETIDERAINVRALHPVQRAENHTLMLNSSRAIGCNVVNIGPQDLMDGVPHLVLGLIWQIVKVIKAVEMMYKRRGDVLPNLNSF
jgi:hypothetical protein